MPKEGKSARRANHVAHLCDEYRIHHEVVQGARGRALPARRVIRTPAVRGIRQYYLALHEIAHVVLADCAAEAGEAYDLYPAVRREEQAWRWALEHATEAPTDGIRRWIFRGLWGYVVAGGSAHYMGAFDPLGRMVPAPDDPFWELLGDLVPDPGRVAYEAAKITSVKAGTWVGDEGGDIERDGLDDRPYSRQTLQRLLQESSDAWRAVLSHLARHPGEEVGMPDLARVADVEQESFNGMIGPFTRRCRSRYGRSLPFSRVGTARGPAKRFLMDAGTAVIVRELVDELQA